ncbi:antirestriction protein ArdA [Robbsia sp. Bb-Pol-6]|uniref:Antirestriction protein ArdA n=1 Tax=Robbsia betulipollinis TaxID=2981849 RepID=A0ABT3ZVP1_9BURK|nr:antirestriction protein ArdA [Robbsia betulipollinis]MCY0389913.1 antirestriction protein ArdA [Robbsia betulipollinis]
MTTILFAQPYSIDAEGFYFTDSAVFDDQVSEAVDRFGCPVEEFEIQFIDGEGDALFDVLQVTQATVHTFFETLDTLTDEQQAVLYFLVSDRGMTVAAALAQVDDVQLTTQTAESYAEDMFDDLYPDLPTQARIYIDISAWQRDLELNGELIEIRFDSTDYVVTNANDF